MAQKWKKLEFLFNVENINDNLYSHAAVPFAYQIDNDVFKIFFSPRNNNNESCITYLTLNIKNRRILEILKKPLLTKGELGAFDDSGVMGSWLLDLGGVWYLYYIGWNLGVTVPFRNSIGLAVSYDNGVSFQKLFKGPIMDRTKEEPFFVASNCVIYQNDIYKMWYVSCTKWEKINTEVRHYYHIKYAESQDGINWVRNGVVAIDYKSTFEYAISRPCVICDKDGKYKMWFSSRASQKVSQYRIRYAESIDGIHWIREEDDKDLVLDVSSSGWDSEMVCYPYVFDHDGNRYMLYNGNGYGKSGFGLAILEQD